LDLRREFVSEAAEQARRERERQLVLGARDDFFEVPEDRRPRFHQRHRLSLAGRCGVAGFQLVDHLRERRLEVTERVVRIDGDDLHRPRFAELDEPSVRKTPNGVVHARLRDIGSVGDVARRQLTVFQHGEVRIDLVLAEVEAVPDAIERAAEVVGHDRDETVLRYRFYYESSCTRFRSRILHVHPIVGPVWLALFDSLGEVLVVSADVGRKRRQRLRIDA